MHPTEPDIDAFSIRDLTRDECLGHLRRATLGRLAVSEGALPLIVPVTYAMAGSDVVFRIRPGGLLDRTCRNTIVAFEVDSYDEIDRSGWSVLAIGVANVMRASDWMRAVELGLVSTGGPDGATFVKIVTGTITGRAVGCDTASRSPSATGQGPLSASSVPRPAGVNVVGS